MRVPLLLFLLVVLCSAISRAHVTRDEEKDDSTAFESIDESSVVPLKLPVLTRAERQELVRKSGQMPLMRRRVRQRVRRARKAKRDLLLAPWRITHAVKATQKKQPIRRRPVALPVDNCPRKFDAVTRAYNGRTYVFARERVFQMWFEDGLQQKASYLITELFPGGPRTVTAALTNSRSGVTILFENRTAYRFRWNRKYKRFQLARNTPQNMPHNITITPQTAFEWTDGNQVVLAGDHFIIYDAYWNLATFTGHTSRYFPNLPRDMLGIVHTGGHTVLMFTKSNSLKVYNTRKYRVVQEYPLKINDYIGCLN